MKIRNADQLLAMLEDGDLSNDLFNEITKVLDALREAAGPKSKAKGSVTLTLNFEVEGVSTEISTDIKSKMPKQKRARSWLFLGEDGLSTEHPRQISMFPQDVDKQFG